jgi:hypothetical protein
MNERINQLFYLFLTIAIGFLAWGLLELNKAGFYRPKLPISTAVNHYSFDRQELVFPLSRYQSLLSGDLFFGELPPPPPPPQVEFKTQLIVIGVTQGANTQDGYAVVGLKKTGDRETWIVNPGQIVGGEQIVSIHNGYIMVKNQTGVGKVPLRD